MLLPEPDCEPELLGVLLPEAEPVALPVAVAAGELLLLLLSEEEGLSLPEVEAEKVAEGVAEGVPEKEGVLDGEALWLGVPDCEAQASIHTSSPEAATTESAKPSEQLSQALPA